jgi:hypothetical protein
MVMALGNWNSSDAIDPIRAAPTEEYSSDSMSTVVL